MPEATPLSKLTLHDLAQMPDDGRRHELIDGAHFVTAAPSTRHQRVLRRLLVRLDAFFAERGEGEVFPAPYDVVLSESDVVEPDLVVVKRAAASRVTEAHLRGAPDLAVEIISDSTEDRDRGLKRKLYERYGVGEYWIVDPGEGSVEVLVLTERGFERLDRFARAETLESKLFPELEIALEDIFEA